MCVVLNTYPDKIIQLPKMVIKASESRDAQDRLVIERTLKVLQMSWNQGAGTFNPIEIEVTYETKVNPTEEEKPKSIPNDDKHVVKIEVVSRAFVGGQLIESVLYTFSDGSTRTINVISVAGIWYYNTGGNNYWSVPAGGHGTWIQVTSGAVPTLPKLYTAPQSPNTPTPPSHQY